MANFGTAAVIRNKRKCIDKKNETKLSLFRASALISNPRPLYELAAEKEEDILFLLATAKIHLGLRSLDSSAS